MEKKANKFLLRFDSSEDKKKAIANAKKERMSLNSYILKKLES